MGSTNVRVVGSNFTTFTYGGSFLAWLTGVTDTGVTPLGTSNIGQAGVEAVTPLGASHPIEYATSRAMTGGMLTLTVKELWNAPAWQQLQGLAGTNNIVEIFEAASRSGTPIGAQMIIKSPGSSTWRGWTYNNVTIVHVDDAESVSLGTMTVSREILAAYTDKQTLQTTATNVVY